jgi:DNA-binding transcriptional regulator GbsR (MarR family)
MEAGLKHWGRSETGGTCLAIMDVKELKIQPISDQARMSAFSTVAGRR